MKKVNLILLLLIVFSCNQEEKERQERQLERVSNIKKIMLKQDIKYSLSELDFNYSYQFNQVIKTGKQLLEDFWIHDIYSKDNKNYAKVSCFDYHFDLLIEDDFILKSLLELDEDNSYITDNKILIIKLNSVKKIDFLVEVNDESYEGEIDFSMEVTESNKFIGKGKLLKIIKI